jgi:hypothetical protein
MTSYTLPSLAPMKNSALELFATKLAAMYHTRLDISPNLLFCYEMAFKLDQGKPSMKALIEAVDV